MSDERSERAREVLTRLFGPRTGKSGAAKPELPPLVNELTALGQRYAFGEVWAREGLPLRTRSLLTVGIMAALFRSDQLSLHIKGALHLGVTPEEILETIYHASLYAGMPAAASGTAVALEVFRKKGLIK